MSATKKTPTIKRKQGSLGRLTSKRTRPEIRQEETVQQEETAAVREDTQNTQKPAFLNLTTVNKRLEFLSAKDIAEFKTFIYSLPTVETEIALARRNSAIEEKVALSLVWTLQRSMGILSDEQCENWKELPNSVFFSTLEKIFPLKKATTSLSDKLEDKIKILSFKFNLREGGISVYSYVMLIKQYLHQEGEVSLEREKEIVKIMRLHFKSKPHDDTGIANNDNSVPSSPAAQLLTMIDGAEDDEGNPLGKPTTVTDFLDRMGKQADILHKAFIYIQRCGLLPSDHCGFVKNTNKTFGVASNNTSFTKNVTRPKENRVHSKDQFCSGCGRKGHTKDNCHYIGHPDFNKTKDNWRYSISGKTVSSKLGYDTLDPYKVAKSNSSEEHKTWLATYKGKNESFYTIHHNRDNKTLIKGDIITMTNIIYCKFMLDTGALHNNYISLETASKLKAAGIKSLQTEETICSGFDNCITTDSRFDIDLQVLNNYNELLNINFSATVAPIPYDIIIGLPLIKKHNLIIEHFPNLVSIDNDEDKSLSRRCLSCNIDRSEIINEGIRRDSDINFNDFNLMKESESVIQTSTKTQQKKVINLQALYLLQKKTMTRETPDTIQEEWEDSDDEFPNHQTDGILIEGPPSLQQKIKELTEEFHDIFCIQVRAEPAMLPPMDFEVDEAKWRTTENRLPPRQQSAVKQDEIHRQISNMIDLNVITSSTESEYSQILLVPKPNNKWRVVIDFRRLNLCSEKSSWPLPLIQQLLRRIGTNKPKYFGVMDLTSGYHQCALSKRSRRFTAFITYMGVFEWLRVPMGLKGAASYFQKVLATIVLAGLLYITLELYLDDIIVYAKNEEEFIRRLKAIFERFRQYKLTLNPNKCRFGLSNVEYLGHLIDEKGITFTREKLTKIIEFRELNTQKDLKQFIGLANYFSSHIQNYAIVAKPLNKLMNPYKPRLTIKWTQEGKEALIALKAAINNCPKLFYVDSTSPIHVKTDASDYGIGGYLYQIIDDIEVPIAFISKSLVNEQLRWHVPEKECYAIIYSLKKWDYLLKDRKFILHTDHKNLTYIDTGTSAKVYRWKLEMQEYDFDIVYLPGVDNQVADDFSRLCNINTQHLSLLEAFELPLDKKILISQAHNDIVGHGGVDRTLNKLSERGDIWSNMKEHVKRFIKTCPCCQVMSYVKVPIHTHPFTTGSYEPFERINIDTIGPLPTDEYGNSYIIVIIDCFSRFLELYPTKDTTAKSAADALLQTMGRFGNPSQILSDRGSQFVNSLIKEYLQNIGVEQISTMAYSKEENSIVERANKETERHLKAIIFDKKVKHKWSKILPIVQRIFNSNTIETIGVSPAQILFGNAINLDRGIFIPHLIPNQNQTRLSEWVAGMLTSQAEVIAIAKQTQLRHDNNHFARFTPLRTEFEINSFVLAKYENSDHRPPDKLMAQYKGPFRVVNCNNNIYTVQNLISSQLEDYHVTNLRPFIFDPNDTDPREIANKVLGLVDVETIIKHKGHKLRKKQMKFLVKWKGFSDKHNQWLDWKDVRDLAVLHTYLANNKLKSLILPQYRHNI